ncbi:PPC domain-containing protein [Leptolyngbya sp. FACHB-261]|uniref:PPC domain-containing protein n=1 Tax=Leptolyngbya sp. FACHB-261 TaxID=2692806 RepID=UPI001687D1F5|nr:PPC domain-containing protein [Leptolyngbya sp. FACHB-261]MBD2102955.1 PPC domain-containing protein [Leptolyngbya sp. FACHB-261]
MPKHNHSRPSINLTCLLSGLLGSALVVSQVLPTNAQQTDIQRSASDLIRASQPAPPSPEQQERLSTRQPRRPAASSTSTSTPSRPANSSRPAASSSRPTAASRPATRPTTASRPAASGSSPASRPSTSTPVATTQNLDIKAIRTESRLGQVAIPAGTRATNMKYGDVIPGVLGREDLRLADGRYVDVYQFQGEQGRPLLINLVGSADFRRSSNLRLDPYLVLLGPDGQIIGQDDDSGINQRIGDALLLVRVPANGTYTILATAQPGDQGRYSLGLLSDNTRFIADEVGELNERSARLNADRSPFNVFQFQGEANQRVTIRASSEDFDPYLILLGPDGKPLAQDDDGGGDLNSLVEVTLPRSGTYSAVVNASNQAGRGRYRLTVN